MADYLRIKERVAAGAQFLDMHEPGWDQRINTASLDVGSCRHCVLGQLAGDYDDGITEFNLGDDDALALGFNTCIGFDALTAEWKHVITERGGGRAASWLGSCMPVMW